MADARPTKRLVEVRTEEVTEISLTLSLDEARAIRSLAGRTPAGRFGVVLENVAIALGVALNEPLDVTLSKEAQK